MGARIAWKRAAPELLLLKWRETPTVGPTALSQEGMQMGPARASSVLQRVVAGIKRVRTLTKKNIRVRTAVGAKRVAIYR
jgi:hypothetical protein